eukprot:gene48345-59207_t
MGVLFSDAPHEFRLPVVTFGEKIGVAFQLIDDVLDLSEKQTDTGKIAGTDLRSGVSTLPMLFLRNDAQNNAASADLLARLDRDVSPGAGPACAGPADAGPADAGPSDAGPADERELALAIAELRAHEVTARTRDEAHRWAREAVEALSPLPEGPVKKALTRFADTVVERNRPAGIYAADILLKAEKQFDVSIDLFEQLPAPYGLVRYGVAPDHPRIKGIITALREVLDSGKIRLFGNVLFGRDVTLDDLKRHYNAVIFSTGAIRDAALNIPGIDLPGSYGAADFV